MMLTIPLDKRKLAGVTGAGVAPVEAGVEHPHVPPASPRSKNTKEEYPMALTEDERKETKALFAEAVAEGLALFRSKEEEAVAKGQQQETPPAEGSTGDNGNSGGLDLAGFILGRK